MNSRYVARVATVACMLLTCGSASGRTLLLYAKEKTFLSQVEHSLSALRDSSTHLPLFRVINLHTWAIGKLDEADLDGQLRSLESYSRLRTKSSLARETDERLRNLISEADAYLRVDVLPRLPLMEFQLTITDSLSKSEHVNYRSLVSFTSRLEGFLVSVIDTNIEHMIFTAFQRVFPESNKKPVVVLKVQGADASKDALTVPVGRPILIDASHSYDPDSPSSNLKFEWKQESPTDSFAPVSREHFVRIAESTPAQSIVFPTVGEYVVAVFCDDGVTRSTTRRLRVSAVGALTITFESDLSRTFSKRGMNKPVVVLVTSPDSTDCDVVVVGAELEFHPSIPDRVAGMKIVKRTIDPGIFRVNRQTLTRRGTQQFSISSKGNLGSGVLTLHILAKNSRVESDTTLISIRARDLSATFEMTVLRSANYNFPNERMEGDTLDIAVYSLRFGFHFQKSKNFGFGFGNFVHWKDSWQDDTHHFRFNNFYVNVEYSYFGVYVVQAPPYTGVILSQDLGKLFFDRSLAFETGYFPRWGSYSIGVKFHSSSSWWLVAWLAGATATAFK